jgi:hypothetical protein
MWTLRTVRGGEKMISTSDSTFATKRAMLNTIARMGEVTYRRRIDQTMIVHVKA